MAFCFAFVQLTAKSQLQDKTWICGGVSLGQVVFNNTSIDTVRLYASQGANGEWACISDMQGNFQFFTNGIYVYSYDGTQMVNGFGLADNAINNYFDKQGLPDEQNVLILPKRGDHYYIIYQSQSDPLWATQPWVYTNMIYYSIVNMSLQNGKGEVITKKETINSGYFMDGKMTACQHANGRDWWLVQRRYNSNGYLVYLITPDSISYKGEQFIGAPSQEPDAIGQSAFSADGSKYATITGKSPLIILDFDRCEGVFSNPVKVSIPIDTFMFYGQQKVIGGGGNGLCFSPSNRFIYVNSLYTLWQYDLLQNPVDSSVQVIFFWTDSNEYLGQFNQMHLAPNGKIYAANYQGFTDALHVINHPDSAGTACGFVKWGLPITTNNANVVSNMLHFRMGALTGSGCDTLNTAISYEPLADRKIQVFPNPASDYIEVDLMNYSRYHPQQQFYLYNTQGQLVKQVALPYLSARLQVSDLPAGVYHWKVAVGVEIRGEGKLNITKE